MGVHLRLRKPGEAVARVLDTAVPDDFAERFREAVRISPGERAWMLVADGARRVLDEARFGFPRRGGGRLAFARAETVHRLPAFRDAFVRRRCAVPVDGFYQWMGEPGARRPALFERGDGGLLLLLGLHDATVDARTGEVVSSFVLLTAPAGSPGAPPGHRTPVVLRPDSPSLPAWLGTDAPGAFEAGPLLALLDAGEADELLASELPRRHEPPRRPAIRLLRVAPPRPATDDRPLQLELNFG